MTGTEPTGGNGVYTYQWESSLTDIAIDFRPIVGAINKTYQPQAALQTIYFRRIVKSGDCAEAISNLVKIQVSISADVVTVKKTTQNFYVPGETVTYTISVKNNGPSEAKSVTVEEQIPVGTVLERWSAVGNGSTPSNASGAGTLKEIIASLGNGAEIIYTVVLRIRQTEPRHWSTR